MKGIFKLNVFLAAIAGLILLLTACGGGKGDRPRAVLPKDKMVALLQEFYIAEEKVNRLLLPRDSAEKVFQLMEGKVFEKTGVPDSIFRMSLDYYMDHPEELEIIYTAVVDSLQLREQRTPARFH